MKYDYTVIRSSRRTLALQIKDGKIIVRAPYSVTNAQIAAFVYDKQDWIGKHLKIQKEKREAAARQRKLTTEELHALAGEARRVIPERVQFYAEKMGVTYGRITIRSQRTRWGSCSSKGNLNFNCLLMLMPPEVLDSVVVHELCHRKVMNHSSDFYNEVHKVYPEYDKWHKWLKENGDRYMNMLPAKT